MANSTNDKFKVLEYRVEGTTVRVYLLNVGDTFTGFGGSRHGLTARKTASLIISESDHGRRDTEYDINNTPAWEAIRKGLLYHPEPKPIGELLEPGENVPATGLTETQKAAAEELRKNRPAVMPGTNIILSRADSIVWFDGVTEAMKHHGVDERHVGLFCDIAGVPD